MVIAFLVLVPVLILFLNTKSNLVKKIGPVTVCYSLGFIISLLPLNYDKNLVQTVSSVFIAIAIPLILFSFDLSLVKKLAKKTLLSFLLLIVCVVLVTSIAAFVASNKGLEYAAELAGMATGLYIGGTPNLFAIGNSLLKDINIVNMANISDALFGGVFFLLIVSFIKKAYQKVLGKKGSEDISYEEIYQSSDYDFSVINKKSFGKLVLIVLLAAGCLGLGALIEFLINGNINGSLFIMITVSVLGILFSLIKGVREVKGSFQVGQYFILVFSLGLSMSIDFSKLVSAIVPTFLYFSSVQVLIMFIHFILCRIFKIDGGTALITCVAGIYGPPFIVPVAQSYDDNSLIVPGIICGTLGLIIGNIIGLAVALLIGAII